METKKVIFWLVIAAVATVIAIKLLSLPAGGAAAISANQAIRTMVSPKGKIKYMDDKISRIRWLSQDVITK